MHAFSLFDLDMSTTMPTPSFDSAPYYERAAVKAEMAVQRRGQYSMIEQAETEWGKIHLHWLVKGAACTKVFEIVIWTRKL